MTSARKHASSSRLEAALKSGIDELHSILEWTLRNRPRALAPWRGEFGRYCTPLYRAIDRAAREHP